jgi:hypothetical protein
MGTGSFSLRLSAAALIVFLQLQVRSQWALDTAVTIGTNASGIAITSDGAKIVATCKSNPGKVVVMNTSNFALTTINISSHENFPDAVAIVPGNTMAVVATTHKLIFINLLTNSVAGVFSAPCVGTTLYGIDITKDGQSVVFPDLSPGCTQQGVRSTSSGGQSSSSGFLQVSTSGVLTGIAMASTGSVAVLTAYSSGGAPKSVNLANSSVQTITGMSSSYGIAAFHSSNEVLIFDGDSVDRVSLTNNSVTKKIAYLTYNTTFQNIAISQDDKYAFVMGAFEKLVISLATNSVVQQFGSGGTNVACNADGSVFYVTDYSNGTVRVYTKSAASGLPAMQNQDAVVRLFPNPSSGAVNLEVRGFDLADSKLVLFDLMGRVVFEIPIQSPAGAIDLQGLSRGLYHYKFQSGVNVVSGKFVVE